MDEFEFIDSIKQTSYSQATLLKGIGDDAAVFRSQSDIITAVDTFVEGVHFNDKTMGAFHIGYKSLAANISDLAAMGARPAFYLVSIVIPKSKPQCFIESLFQGMKQLAGKYKMDLIGGDTVSGSELTISITVIGYIEKNKACYRSDAKVDDIVFASGTLGDSRAGLEVLLKDLNISDKQYFTQRHQMPEPRVELGLALGQLNRVALNDVSDGIANELQEISTASNVDILIDDVKIPIHPSLKQFSETEQFNWKLFGGEDFELVGAVPKRNWKDLSQIAKILDIKLTEIGKVGPCHDQPQVYIKMENKVTPLLKKGYTHLK